MRNSCIAKKRGTPVRRLTTQEDAHRSIKKGSQHTSPPINEGGGKERRPKKKRTDLPRPKEGKGEPPDDTNWARRSKEKKGLISPTRPEKRIRYWKHSGEKEKGSGHQPLLWRKEKRNFSICGRSEKRQRPVFLQKKCPLFGGEAGGLISRKKEKGSTA